MLDGDEAVIIDFGYYNNRALADIDAARGAPPQTQMRVLSPS